MPTRTPDNFIDHFVSLVLSHIDREYPNKLDHVINGPEELQSPRELHPIFYGSFDWHSSVHGHWLLVRALRNYPELAQAADVRALIDKRITDANVAIEVAYLGQTRRETFERPYGWGWLLKLVAEILTGVRGKLATDNAAALSRWNATLAPLAGAFVECFLKYLPKATYPIRVGTHHNTAFALAIAFDYARVAEHRALNEAIRGKARAWYLKDENYPAWEPDGSDFLSPGLCEAELMRRVLPAGEFLPWFDAFFPKLAQREPATLFKPAFVSDRTDGHITHLDGLNLSRAWCWRSLAAALPESDPRKPFAEEAYRVHVDAALPHVTGDYVGEHWLATFALLALTE
jgi:hypothetical protein